MVVEIYIDNQLVDIYEKDSEKVKYTLQVNNIGDLKSRESSFTSNIKLPKTSKNKKIFEFAGALTHLSDIPYKKLKVDYKVNGIDIIKDGYGFLKSSTVSHYNFHIKDGAVDLFKAIENKGIQDNIDWNEITHVKNKQTIEDSWFGSDLKDFMYLLADYNGKTFIYDLIETDLLVINLEFQLPCIRLKWLWDKIFDYYGFTYSGNFFNDDYFLKTYFTPSSVNKEIQESGAYFIDDIKNETSEPSTQYSGQYPENTGFYDAYTQLIYPNQRASLEDYTINWISYNISNTFSDISLLEDKIRITNAERYIGVKVKETNTFRLLINAQNIKIYSNNLSTENRYIKLAVYKNIPHGTMRYGIRENNINQYKITEIDVTNYFTFSLNNYALFEANNLSIDINLDILEDDIISIGWLNEVGFFQYDTVVFYQKPYSVRLLRPDVQIDPFQIVSNFKIKDLFKEILVKHGLTPIKRKGENHYDFYTISERLNEAPVLDWSNKFNKVISEKYTIGSYARENIFAHKYDEENESFNDYSYEIDNKQIKEVQSIDSKFYTEYEIVDWLSIENDPESNPLDVIASTTQGLSSLKLWEREINESNDGQVEIKYKELKDRFHWVEAKQNSIIGTPYRFESDPTSNGDKQSYKGDHSPHRHNVVTPLFYNELKRLTDKMVFITAEFNLSELDISQFSFYSRIYIEQLGAYFLPNKIISWQPNKLTKVELIKIN